MVEPQPAVDEPFAIEAAIERFEGTDALIKTKDGTVIRWPIKRLPDDATPGATVRLVLRTSGSEQLEREQVAKTILNEMLKTER